MTTIPKSRQSADHAGPPPSGRATRTLLLRGLSALAFSFLMLVALRVSTNPAPEEFAFEVMAWVHEVALVIGAVLVAAAVARRAVQP